MNNQHFEAMEHATPTEKAVLSRLALGRIFRLCSRPFQEGDCEQYEECRAIIMVCSPASENHAPNYARDRLKGAEA